MLESVEAERTATVPAYVDLLHRAVHDHTDEALRTTVSQSAPSLASLLSRPSLTPASIVSQPPSQERDASAKTTTQASSLATLLSSPSLTPQTVVAPAPVVSRPTWHEPDALTGTTTQAPTDRSITIQNGIPRAPSTTTPLLGQPEPVMVDREHADQGHSSQPGVPHAIVALRAPGPDDAKSASHPLVTPIIERVDRVRENSDQGPVDRLSTVRMPRLLTAASRPMSRAQASAPPEIHVTIGRIEVRATLPPTPVKRAAPAQPAASLEEYLRSRSGGKR